MTNYGNILLVEDDASLAQWVVEYLNEQGFSVTHIGRGDEAVDLMRSTEFDLILLDIMLPGLDGIEVCKIVRGFTDTPIIMMTARSDEFDEVIGLEVGANDYVIKPVRPRALLARIKVLLRQDSNPAAHAKPRNELVFGNLRLDNNAKQGTLADRDLNLSSGLFDLLWLIATNAGTITTREQVFQTLTGREYDGLDRRFDVMISQLRRKVNDDPQNPKRIKTVWGKGYLFVANAWNDYG
ncbi:response regulator transcription factor [Alteromonas oceanisediminis]|uniref:response regulator transcription factor n=1 Tax=Alteromonas oceanisediminis TaxID=2836180 RepID=UPI001BDA1155|nr:response regulator transcription factor [Alteromonas oceanisediminis]MBT0586136.1 response regulator transcription factor [Alteromonas oceanisediminis]